ncbi:hypothetical protein HYE67_001842 [Fusarium culmorum]|uniref:Uncharacterized protein n=1 Tax=Fusarium culmorum TaxID=5516 RepID=A0A7S8D0B8_FUSCU|nr:hypothetical protein HYE67_001842 [Fusarium culmorum]
MPLTTIAHSHFTHDDYPSVTSPRPNVYGQGRSMDVTASTLQRTSPLDFDFAKIQPFVKSGTFLEPHDTTALSSNESHASALPKRKNRSAMRFSSNAGIIEEYARSWNSKDISISIPHDADKGFEQLVSPTTADNTPRWPFINDDSLNTPDSADPEPLFPSSASTVSHPRQIHRIDEDLEDLSALYVSPLDAVPESPIIGSPLPPPIRSSNRPLGKVMTAAEFESLRRRKVLEETERLFYEGENEDDKIDYDKIDHDTVDEVDLAKRQMTQRKRQQQHLDSYRQQMMKTTKGHELPHIRSHSRISSTLSFTTTVRGHREDIPTQYGDEDEDEDDVPLAILQMKQRSGGREAPMHTIDGRSDYGLNIQPAPGSRRQQPRSPMPAFASKLPRDPFAGNVKPSWPMGNQQLIPGGLVGVIASEERAKARRRVPPSHGFQPLPDTNNAFNWGSSSCQPPSMPGTYGMPMTQPLMPSYSRPQTPVAAPQPPPAPINHQMFNFLKAQTEFFRNMATINQQRSGQPWDNFSSQQSVMNGGVPSGMPGRAPSNYAPSNYAPSNYAPSNYASSNYARSTYARSNYAKSVHQRDERYSASVAPSERNTVGMPSRYRPVSKTAQPVHAERGGQAVARVSTSSDWNHNRNVRMDPRAILEADTTDSDDDEASWRARKAKRDRRRAMCFQDNDLGFRAEWIR